jgi:hypothetical protein
MPEKARKAAQEIAAPRVCSENRRAGGGVSPLFSAINGGLTACYENRRAGGVSPLFSAINRGLTAPARPFRNSFSVPA